jgi:SAM-dependent methyltransferase
MFDLNYLLDSVARRVRRVFMSPAERRYELVGPVDQWEMKRRFQFDFVRRAGLKPDSYFCSIGCGVLRGGVPIIDYLNEGRFCGIDARHLAIAEAKVELMESKLEFKQPQLIVCEHLSTLSLDRQFDFIWSFSTLIHMRDEVLEEAIQFVSRHMKPNGMFCANVDTANARDGIWQGFPHVHRPVSFYQEACDRHGLALKDLGPLFDLGHVSRDAKADAHRMLKIMHKR